jgi:hypothetical protein
MPRGWLASQLSDEGDHRDRFVAVVPIEVLAAE